MKLVDYKELSDEEKYGWNHSMVCIGQTMGQIHSSGWERKSFYFGMKEISKEYNEEYVRRLYEQLYIKKR